MHIQVQLTHTHTHSEKDTPPTISYTHVSSLSQSRLQCGLVQVSACHSPPFMCGNRLTIKQRPDDTGCLKTVLYPSIGDMGGQNGEKLGSPAWNYGPKQCILMWFIFDLLNFIQSMQLHAPAFPERQKQCSTDLGFDLHLIIG